MGRRTIFGNSNKTATGNSTEGSGSVPNKAPEAATAARAFARPSGGVGRSETAVSEKNGGEDGIRTHETLLRSTPLAGERLRPLGHLSGETLDKEKRRHNQYGIRDSVLYYKEILHPVRRMMGGCVNHRKTRQGIARLKTGDSVSI